MDQFLQDILLLAVFALGFIAMLCAAESIWRFYEWLDKKLS